MSEHARTRARPYTSRMMTAPDGSEPPELVAGDPPTTEGLVARARSGDMEAFERLYHAHAPAMLALCRRMLGSRRDPSDVVQDIFVRVWERLPSFRGDSSLATWLHRLGVNVILDALRAAQRDALQLADDVAAEVIDVREEARARDATGQLDLEVALDRLPAGARTVLVLHDVEGYSHDEIARMTGIAPGTSRAQLWRARRQLARLLHP